MTLETSEDKKCVRVCFLTFEVPFFGKKRGGAVFEKRKKLNHSQVPFHEKVLFIRKVMNDSEMFKQHNLRPPILETCFLPEIRISKPHFPIKNSLTRRGGATAIVEYMKRVGAK